MPPPDQIEVNTSKQTRSQIRILTRVLYSCRVWVLTWLAFPHHRVFRLGSPELEGVLCEALGAPPRGTQGAEFPAWGSSAVLRTLHPGTLRAARLEWGWGWGGEGWGMIICFICLRTTTKVLSH